MKTIGELRYSRNWDCDGAIVMETAQTIERYKEIKKQQPSGTKLGFFFAFSNGQFKEGYKMLIKRGHIKEGDKVLQGPAGLFGTKKGLDALKQFYNDLNEQIRNECDPQEVYFYEYNNYECMYSYDGDSDAYLTIVDVWGTDIAKTIVRI